MMGLLGPKTSGDQHAESLFLTHRRSKQLPIPLLWVVTTRNRMHSPNNHMCRKMLRSLFRDGQPVVILAKSSMRKRTDGCWDLPRALPPKPIGLGKTYWVRRSGCSNDGALIGRTSDETSACLRGSEPVAPPRPSQPLCARRFASPYTVCGQSSALASKGQGKVL